ncbi:MAG: hypothetical protein NWF04_02380 [Candidatus Bathyarchaeota archaeon]|nr:hypothetical protein [Candidatus Bathyarchaeota archaeon]
MRRVRKTVDILNPADKQEEAMFLSVRKNSIQHFYLGMKESVKLVGTMKLVLARMIPSRLSGVILAKNGDPAQRLQISIDFEDGNYLALTDKQGSFTLSLGDKIHFFPESKTLTFKIKGANKTLTVEINSSKIDAQGTVENITLTEDITPLPVSIITSLKDLLPPEEPTKPTQEKEETPTQPGITLGEENNCLIKFMKDYTVDRFPFGVFFRLVEPKTSVVSAVRRIPLNGIKFFYTTMFETGKSFSDENATYIDRVPIEQPISVDGFRDQIIGIDGATTVGPQENVPMAGTLGLGYVVRMSQSWTPKDYTLGNLVYSLPLAPGEQQKVAVFERTDIASVSEMERLDVTEQQRQLDITDTSAQAIATSSFNEVSRGGSEFETIARSSSHSSGLLGGLFGGGSGGSSSSQGSSYSWMEGIRNSFQSVAERTHASVQRQAAARRSALRTSMRIASAAESQNVTTRVITNHNHTRALTLQYWEVQRLYEVSMGVEGVTLVCLVPLEVVRFLPCTNPRQPLTLTNANLVSNREALLQRYSLILKHSDILAKSLPRQYLYGLSLLTQFASDPTAEVQPAGSAAEAVIKISLTGTFLPFEDIYVSAVTKRGSRIGPVRLEGTPLTIPDLTTTQDATKLFFTKDALIGFIREKRHGSDKVTYDGRIVLPPSVARNDIVGFEVSRRFRTYEYSLISPSIQTLMLFKIELSKAATIPNFPLYSQTVRLSPSELEKEIGGPLLLSMQANLQEIDFKGNIVPAESYLHASVLDMELPPTMPIPARQLPPVLRFNQVLEIEKTLQHVVRNTVAYSKAVWLSLTPEERAIMLEGFTIGVPQGGITDESQMVPLLNCVENRLLGFYGNSMIMPFIIPPALAEEMQITSGQIQDMLTNFHKRAFSPPKGLIALPTRGVLAEAVLGSCPSAEKIDITRFWNWQDAPVDTAPEIAPVTVPTTTPPLTTGLNPPSTLTGMPPLINNLNATAPPTADTTLLQALTKAAAEQKGFSTDITGASLLAPLIKGSQETAEKARADALKTTRETLQLAMSTAGNIIGAYKGNPTAGSDALRALTGTPSEKKETKKTDDKTKKETEKSPGKTGSTNSGEKNP